MTYALCGFANLGSLGIFLGGMCAIRRTSARNRSARALDAGVRHPGDALLR